jgi:hypothetical protein
VARLAEVDREPQNEHGAEDGADNAAHEPCGRHVLAGADALRSRDAERAEDDTEQREHPVDAWDPEQSQRHDAEHEAGDGHAVAFATLAIHQGAASQVPSTST